MLKNLYCLAGTVFREPILCKNVPKLVPGNNVWPWLWFCHGLVNNVHYLSCFVFCTCVTGRMDKTHMYWKACFWWPVQSNRYSYQGPWQAEISFSYGFMFLSSYYFFILFYFCFWGRFKIWIIAQGGFCNNDEHLVCWSLDLIHPWASKWFHCLNLEYVKWCVCL